jgi:hypothetical protein
MICIGRALRYAVSADLSDRCQKCQNRFVELNGLFDRTVIVETQLYVKDIHAYTMTKREDRSNRVQFIT